MTGRECGYQHSRLNIRSVFGNAAHNSRHRNNTPRFTGYIKKFIPSFHTADMHNSNNDALRYDRSKDTYSVYNVLLPTPRNGDRHNQPRDTRRNFYTRDIDMSNNVYLRILHCNSERFPYHFRSDFGLIKGPEFLQR